MSDLLNTLSQQLGPDVIERISKQLGTDPQTAQKGVQLGLPLLMSALARNSASPEGARSLAGALRRDHDGRVLADLSGAVDSYQQGPGDAILGHILGDQRGQVERTISQGAGIDGAALLQILAPIVMAVLGQMQHQRGLDPGGLSDELQNERGQMQRRNGGLMDVVTGVLDTNKNGSAVDDVIGMIGRYMSSNRT